MAEGNARQSTNCECLVAGWCGRHKCRKTEHLWMLCRTRSDYFRLWEEGRGPGQRYSRSEPGLARKAVNVWRAVVRYIASRRLRVKRAAYRQRLEICRGCPALDPERMVCREKNCGCNVERKAKWASENCPIGKWPTLENTAGETPASGQVHESRSERREASSGAVV
jgi:hypothetical protein